MSKLTSKSVPQFMVLLQLSLRFKTRIMIKRTLSSLIKPIVPVALAQLNKKCGGVYFEKSFTFISGLFRCDVCAGWVQQFWKCGQKQQQV